MYVLNLNLKEDYINYRYGNKSRPESDPTAERYHFMYSTSDNPEKDLTMARQELNLRSCEVSWMDNTLSSNQQECHGIVLGTNKQQLEDMQKYLVDKKGWSQSV
jgi:hypothetical protein